QLMVKYGFDGLDIDWEYPVGGGEAGNINRPEDKQNYTLLLQTLRQELNKQQAIDGKQYQLTVASPASSSTMANFELSQISQYIDFFNLMAYDYHGSTFESTTNHNAPLYAASGQQSIDSTIQGYLNAGVAAEDIVLGAPAYGYGWAGVPNINNGLFQSSSGKASGTWATGVYDYKDLYNRLQTQPSVYTRYWDDIAKVPYIYSPTDQRGMFSSYEDSQSIGIKTNYIKDKGLGGMFFWELSSDLAATNNDSLVNNAYKYLTLGQNPGGSPTITLAVSPSSVNEDGTANLIYTFTRTGATTNALTVNYNVAGTATFNNDYTQIGAASFTATTGTITFAAGSSTKTLTIDPTADTTVESNETVALTLATGTGYTVGTTTAVTGTITNDDTAGPLTLTGDATNNNLVGGSANDTFLGLGGQDTLTGGLGADRFRFNSPSDGMDTITDFSKAQGDKIELFGTGFNSLVWTDGVTNALAPIVFSMGTSANSWTNSIIYNNSNGIVYFDADALGSGSQVALAQLSPGLNLTNQDFIVSWV
ncbi:glycosyl hydrolase family 18 protein, partial [Dolichospermum circinale CS-1225]|uniref:glycosyl hydrolase family 18 protein n=4 Tax=Dolichospermum circinale TaxID=109265 RepID=UPI00232E9F19